MRNSVKRKLITVLIFICSFLFIDKVYSATDEAVLEKCPVSKEYLEWEKLSAEEKINSIVPEYCDIEASTKEYHSFSFSVKGTLPSKYDIRTTNYVSSVKDQKQTGSCWAHSATTIAEVYSKRFLNVNYTFSTRHIVYSSTRDFLNGAKNDHGFNTVIRGGNSSQISSYFINGYGPIAESEMPFVNNEDLINISEIQNKTPLLDVNDVVDVLGTKGDGCTTTEIEDIKRLVYENGAVYIHILIPSTHYNSTTAAAYYNGEDPINHAVTIVGWDDNYSKNNFLSSNRPSSNGAFIVQNSYGTSWGDGGYFYLSYEDVHVCDRYMTITDADTTFEDNSYILDKLGHGTNVGYSKQNYAYAMNVFTKSSTKSELLDEITFATAGSGSYKIYYKEGKATTTTTISSMREIGSGTIDHRGYLTHELSTPILLSKGVTNFSIAIYFNLDNQAYQIPVSDADEEMYKYIEIEKGRSFSSSSGNSWYDLADGNAVASIKAFSNDVSYSMKLDSYTTSYSNTVSAVIKTTSTGITSSKVTATVKNSNGTSITTNSVSYSNGNINISLPGTTPNGTYNVEVKYDGKYVGTMPIQVNHSITSSTYTINNNNKLIYVQPKTSISTFKSKITGSSGAVYSSSTLVSSGYVTTGMTIDDYKIIVKGDVTNDGEVKMNDVMKISKYIIDQTGLDSNNLKAADVNLDSNIKMNDVMKISSYIIDGGTL